MTKNWLHTKASRETVRVAMQAQLAFLDDYRRSGQVSASACSGGANEGPALFGAGLQNLRADGTAVQLTSLFGVAASAILQHSSTPALPPWLYKVWQTCPKHGPLSCCRDVYKEMACTLGSSAVCCTRFFDTGLLLLQALKEGVERAGFTDTGDGVWASHGDAGGLAMLLLRWGRLEVCVYLWYDMPLCDKPSWTGGGAAVE
jgi:hypothetical protein